MTPPHDEEAERSVLGALLLGPTQADEAEAYLALTPDSFYRTAHAMIFAACLALYEKRTEIDSTTVTTRLRENGTLEQAGGTGAILTLGSDTPTTANLPEYVRTVQERAMRRQLIAAATVAHKAAQQLDVPITDTLDRVAETISQVATTSNRAEIVTMSTLIRQGFKKLQARAASGDEPTGVKTGFHELDAKLGGLQKGEVTLLAGRPGMGKTALACAIAENASLRDEKHTLVFSLEMHRDALALRSLASHSRVDSQKLRLPAKLDDSEWSRLTDACAKLDTELLSVVDAANLTVLEIRSIARLQKARRGLGLIVVDYIGLVRPMHRYPSAREREVAEISAGFKSLAKELDVPVLCLSQLSRGLESREDKRPRLSDLRESGSLEQDADVVLFVHRSAYYDPDEPKDLADIIIAKQRNGPIGVVTVGWEERCTKFYNPRRLA